MTTRRIVLTIAGGLMGYAVYGLITAVAGAVLGFASSFRPELAAVTAMSLLVATGVFVATEQTLDLSSFGTFVETRPTANWTGRLASVAWMLAVLLGWIHGRTPDPIGVGAEAAPVPVPDPVVDRNTPRSPEAVAVVGTVAAISSLLLFGDRTWAWTVIPVAVGALVLLAAFHLPRFLQSDWTAVMRAIPGRGSPPASGRTNELVSGSVWMLSGTAVVSIGSFVFWIAAARTSTQESVGAAAALFSVLTFLNYATSLGLPIALSRFASDVEVSSSSVLFTWTLGLTTSSSIVGVGVFALFAPASVDDAIGSTFGWLILVLNVVGMSLSVLVDVRCMTLRLWRWFFWRTVAISVIRLPFLLLLPEEDATLFLFNVVAGAYGLTGLIWLGLLVARSKERLRMKPAPPGVSGILRYAIVNYFGQLAIQGPFFAVPLIVLTTLSAEDNATFYLAWGIMSVVVISVQIIGQVLLVEGGRGHDMAGQARVAVSVGLAVSMLSLVAVSVLGSIVRGIYGPGYEDVSSLLVILVAGTVPYAVTVVGLNTARVKSDHQATIAIAFTFAALVLVPTLVLTDGHGAVGAAWGWLIGNAAAALVVVSIHHPQVSASLRPTRAHTPAVVVEGLAGQRVEGRQ